MTWKPISEYPIEQAPDGARGPAVLARDDQRVAYIVIMNRGQFFPCPGSAIFYGDRKVGFMTVSNLVEFMEIPE
jgi:hypothetical protein